MRYALSQLMDAASITKQPIDCWDLNMSSHLHEPDNVKQMSHVVPEICNDVGSSQLGVYEITARHVQVRSEPCEHARIDDYILPKGQLVAAYPVKEHVTDESLTISTSTNHKYKTGPYLKLADGSGYIFENKAVGAGTLLQTICEQLPVTRLPVASSICYVHPSLTVELRTHPNVSSAMLRTLDPLQKVICEIKLKHKDTDWYHVRLSDGTQGWVTRQALSDTNADESYDNGMSTHEQLDDESSPTRQHDRLNLEHEPLIPESCIQFGLFAYVALQPIAIRASPTVSNASRTGVIVETNDVTLATVVVREKRSDEYEAYTDNAPTNGPFLYLPRLGWVFEYKAGRPIMQKLGVAQGAWTLNVQSQGVYPCLGPVLCASRSNQNIQRYFLRDKNDANNDEPTLYAAGTELSSDVCVASNGATYYRVTDRPHHWICQANEQDGQLEVVRTCHANDTGVERKISVSVQKSSERDLNERSTSSESTQHDGWTEDFVRGVASLMEGLTTKLAPEPGKLVYMKNKVTIQIECRARFVTVRANEHSSTNYPECTSKQLSIILSDPLHASANTTRSAIPMKIPPPVRFAAPFSSTSSRNESDGSVKSIFHSQLTDVEEQLAHHAARKRELESAIQQLEREESGSLPPSRDVSATKLSASTLRDFGLADHAGGLASTEGSRTVSYGATSSSVDTTPHRGKPVIASEVNLVCGVCHHEFTYPRERRKHCLDVHGLLSCNFCTAVFETKVKLHAHRDDRDHW
ncbi:hypothetical protein MPSEU_000692200 [Mayamaea pseudoterrestris]|nr:hypothetical protein MPSEU_000692200 [Mayamaea pseudoterrestris]